MKLPISIKLAIRNVFRNKIRTMITLAAIAFGSVSIIIAGGFFEDTFMQMREAVIHSHLGHIQVYMKGYSDHGATAPYDYLIENPEPIQKKLMAQDHVKSITPRIAFSGMLSTGENTIAVFSQGVDPEGEKILTELDSIDYVKSALTMVSGSNLSKGDQFEIILGKGLAKNLGAKVGDSLVLLTNTVAGSMNAFDMTVKGIFYTSSKAFDDHAIRLPMKTAQLLIRTKAVQTLVITLDKTENTLAAKEKILKALESMEIPMEIKIWLELADFYNKTVDLYSRQFFILKMIITIIVILSIFNTINMSIWERTREIGTIMALGYKKLDIMKLFLTEGLILGFLGGIFGIILGLLLARIISWIGIPMPPPPGATMEWIGFIRVVPHLLTSSMAISVFASFCSSFYPALKASRLVITDALRHY